MNVSKHWGYRAVLSWKLRACLFVNPAERIKLLGLSSGFHLAEAQLRPPASSPWHLGVQVAPPECLSDLAEAQVQGGFRVSLLLLLPCVMAAVLNGIVTGRGAGKREVKIWQNIC